MNVPLITMEPEQARAKLDSYRAQLRRRADAEYEAAALGYEELAKGRPLLNMPEAFAAAGVDGGGWPRLGLARADRHEVEVTYHPRAREWWFDTRKRGRFGSTGTGGLVLRVSYPLGARDSWERRYALVPMIPADVRPRVNLRECAVLWEVLAWTDKPHTARPPRDPFLVRRIGGDLWAILAEWDLTPLEQAIVAGRRPEGA